MEPIFAVSTGEIRVARMHGILVCEALGSCIGIAAYHISSKTGVMSHIMLPGTSPYSEVEKRLHYASDSIDKIVSLFSGFGIGPQEVGVCIAGGGNVLCRPDDTICYANIKSVISALDLKKIRVAGQSLGGSSRRSLSLDVMRGIVACSEADGPRKTMHLFNPVSIFKR